MTQDDAAAPSADALLDRVSVDVVVSDFMMPGMNGIELLREVAAKWPRARRASLDGTRKPGGCGRRRRRD